MDHTTVTAAVAGHELFSHDRSIYLGRTSKDPHLEIVGRQHPNRVHVGDRPGGAEHGEAPSRGTFNQLVPTAQDRFGEGRGAGDFQPFGAEHGNGLEVLGTHHCADAGAACSPALVVHDAGGASAILAAWPD